MAPSQPKKAPAAKETAKPSESTKNGASTPTSTPAVTDSENGFTKPDQAAYNNEQNDLRAKIDTITVQLNALKEKIGSTNGKGPSADRRAELRTELDAIKSQQSGSKGSRTKVIEQLKALQESSQKRAKDLQTAKQKAPFKTVADIETHIRNQERSIESGSLTITAEKKAIADISASKRARKTVEGFEFEQTAIDADRAKADELRKQLDDPESKARSERYDAIISELDGLKAQGDEAYANRNKLFDQRKELQTRLDELWTDKKEKSRLYKEAGDRYYKRVAEERAKKAERYAAQRAAAEEEKRQEIALRLREEAEAPAFQAQIEDCQTLIDFLTVKAGGGAAATSIPTPALNATRTEIAGVPKLEGRTIDASANEGLVVRKKKGEDEENYFVSSKGKKKGPKTPSTASSTPTDAKLNLPLPTLSALMSLSIPPPSSTSDIARTIEDLKTKKEWFSANQLRVTTENINKADAEIKRLAATGSSKNASGAATPTSSLPNGKAGEYPVEPVPTPAVDDAKSSAVEADGVDSQLEAIKESEPEAVVA